MSQNTKTPRVSVIIPTYNRVGIVTRALDSVIAQTFGDFEIIIVDDGSDDDTGSVVGRYSDDRIRYIRHDKNGGLSKARNTGIKNARGPYIAFLDDDDEWLPRKLELQLAHMARNRHIDASYTGCICWDEKSNRETGKAIPSEIAGNHDNLLKENFYIGAASSMVMKSSCFGASGFFDESLPSYEDWDMWIRLARHHRIEPIDDILVKKYMSECSMMGNIKDRITAGKMILEKIASELGSRKDILAYHHFRTGILHCQSGDLKAGRKETLETIRLSPLKGKHYVLYISTFCGAKLQKRLLRFRWATAGSRPIKAGKWV